MDLTVEEYRKQAEAGDLDSIKHIARCYEKGNGVKVDRKEFFKWCQKAAMMSDAEMQCEVGQCYHFGIGVRKDEKKAFAWFERAARQGYAQGQLLLGQMYGYGWGVRQNYEQALNWYLLAAEQGNPEAMENVADAYLHGKGVEADGARAIEWFEKAAEYDEISSMYMLEQVCAEQVDRKFGKEIDMAKYAALWTKFYEGGSSEAGLVLADLFRMGLGVRQDDETAVRMYEEAMSVDYLELYHKELIQEAKNGKELYAYLLGVLYLHKDSVLHGQGDGIKYLKRAAKQGNAKAQSFLAGCYAAANGIKQDDKKAFDLYLQAAEQGLVEAQYEIGMIYLQGLGTEQNFERAYFWMSKSADKGYVWAEYALGLIYDNGWGINRDVRRATKLFREAALKGDEDAMTEMAVCYEEGKGVRRNLKEAVAIYRIAAEKGSQKAQRRLAKCILDGRGTPRDEEEGVRRLQEAADSDPEAMTELGTCYFLGTGVKQSDKMALRLWKRAAKQEDAKAQYALSRYAKRTKKTKEAFSWLKKAADNGLADAQYEFGSLLLNDPEANDDEAIDWIERAAKQGYADAMYQLYVCYHYGIHVEKDETKGDRWLSAAAEAGERQAQTALGCSCVDRRCCAKRLEKDQCRECRKTWNGTQKKCLPEYWLRKAAESGFLNAQYQLGKFYMDYCCNYKKYTYASLKWLRRAAYGGHTSAQLELAKYYSDRQDGSEADYGEVYRWSKMASDAGNLVGTYNLALCYLKGFAVKKDIDKAISLLEASGKEDCLEAQKFLGSLFYFGNYGVKPDGPRALYWFERASEEDAEAMRMLGLCYEEGKGCAVDLYKAGSWYRQAANEGDTDAMISLGILFFNGKGYMYNRREAFHWFEKADDCGAETAKYYLGISYYYGDGFSAPNMRMAARCLADSVLEKDYEGDDHVKTFLEACNQMQEADFCGETSTLSYLQMLADEGYVVAKRLTERCKALGYITE